MSGHPLGHERTSPNLSPGPRALGCQVAERHPCNLRTLNICVRYDIFVRISPDAARGLEFEKFVQEILDRSRDIELTAASSSYGTDYGFDFRALRDGRPLLIQIKLTTPQTGYRLEQLNALLKAAAKRYEELNPGQEPGLVLAIPGVLSQSKMAIALRSRLEVWDGPYLRTRAQSLGISVPPYVALEGPEVLERADMGSQYTHALLHRLNGIRPGQVDWSAYEKYCEDLLNFLFVPPLNPAIPQSRDEHHANRRDYILPNYALDGGFWQFMRGHYDAHYVVAEIKNLRGCPGKREILQVANYLNPHGTGLFALVLARKELDETARWICREQWVQHNKLIVGIHDEDVRQMVETKLGGNDPAELVRQKIEDFRLGI
jgi:hypothetical protein